jgi:DNA invertase Pin-like site-specific DNA recombinase
MTKITPDHLQRAAYIYIRQSTLEQVHVNLESKRRQYALAERARQLGFSEAVVIDEDLGRSGGGTARPGFDRLIGAVGSGVVGAVFAVEASRLARNGRDWHTLLEFCGLVGSLIVDEEGIYDPRLSNDRLLLGMKGTISEMELSAFRQRSREAIREKSKRGELLTLVAIGYVRTSDNRLELDPDKRVRAALQLVFQKFREFGSMRQVQVWLSQERIDRTRERVAEVKRDQRQRGRYLGGAVPWGYRVGEAGELVPIPEQQAAIRQMRKLRDQGLALRAIAAKMKAADVSISHAGVKNALAAADRTGA